MKFGREPDASKEARPVPRGQGVRKNPALLTFVVVAPTREIIEGYVIPRLKTFLSERGLSLSEEKTQIVHRTNGVNFLGFVVQQHYSLKRSVCLARPSKKAIQNHLKAINEILSHHKQGTAEWVIEKLNPIIRGWGNYYRYSNAKETFNYIDCHTWRMLWHWCLRRHPEKSKKWVREKYFRTINGRKWVFATSDTQRLIFTASIRTDSTRYAKVKGYNSPFDPSLRAYWIQRARGNKRNMNWRFDSQEEANS